jgi:hypothetical protein
MLCMLVNENAIVQNTRMKSFMDIYTINFAADNFKLDNHVSYRPFLFQSILCGLVVGGSVILQWICCFRFRLLVFWKAGLLVVHATLQVRYTVEQKRIACFCVRAVIMHHFEFLFIPKILLSVILVDV